MPSHSTNFLQNNSNLTYLFTVEKAGTFWYQVFNRMHNSIVQYGPLVVFDPTERSTFYSLGSSYGVEDSLWILFFGDWFDSKTNQQSIEINYQPIPDAFTVNNQFRNKMVIEIDPLGDPIRVRVINTGEYSPVRISVDGLPLQLIELDSTQVQPVNLQFIYLNAAQRCSFVLDFSPLSSNLANSSSLYIRFSVPENTFPTYNNSIPNNNLYGTVSGNIFDLEWTGTIKFTGRNYPIGYTEPPSLNFLSPAPDVNILVARALRPRTVRVPS